MNDTAMSGSQPSRSLTEPQTLAAQTFDRSVAVMASAGSGKTTVLIERYLGLLRRGYLPSQILFVTFTNEAADQLKARILQRLRHQGADLDSLKEIEQTRAIGTLHSFCFRVLEEFGSVLGLPPVQGIVDTLKLSAFWHRAYREWWEQLGEQEVALWLSRYSRTEIKALAREIVPTLTYLDFSREPDEALRTLLHSLNPLKEALETRFLRQGIFSFDELEAFTEKLLTHNSAVRETLQNRFRAVCVDEFQDTSPSQWRILTALVGQDRRKLFVVGDPKQSIYSFRGADVSVFLQAVSWIEKEQGLHVRLAQNFRSQPSLLDSINQLALPLFETSAVPFEPMVAGLTSSGTSGSRAELVSYSGSAPEGEADRVIELIREKLQAGVVPAQIALLFRVSDRIGYFEARLRQAGIPARSKKTVRLFQQYEYLDLFAYLRALIEPTSPYSLTAFLRSRFGGLSYADLVLLNREPGESLLEKAKGKLNRLRWFFELMESPPTLPSALTTLFAQTGWLPSHPQTFLKLLEGWENEEIDLKEAVEHLRAWESDGLWVSPAEEKHPTHSEVTLLTVHAAKGLEYDHVYLVDGMRMSPNRSDTLLWDDGHFLARHREGSEWIESEAFQIQKEKIKLRDAEEGARILYVALTRARNTLTLLTPADPSKAPRGSWVRLLCPKEDPDSNPPASRLTH